MDSLCSLCNPNIKPGQEDDYTRYHHPGQCREVDSPWVTYEIEKEDQDFDPYRDFDPYYRAGETIRDEVVEPDGHPYPEDAPGYKRIASDRVEAIVVVMSGAVIEEVTPQHFEDSAENDMSWDPLTGNETWWEIAYRVRPATKEEAAGFIAQEEAEELRFK